MSNKVFKISVDKMGSRGVDDYIGADGELFYDPNGSSGLRRSDGETIGGLPFGSSGGGSSSGSVKILNTDTPGMQIGEGIEYTLTAEDFGSTLIAEDVNIIWVPSNDLVPTPIGTFITIIADSEVAIAARQYNDDGISDARVYKVTDASGTYGDSTWLLDSRSIATLVCYREDSGRWLLSGPAVSEN